MTASLLCLTRCSNSIRGWSCCLGLTRRQAGILPSMHGGMGGQVYGCGFRLNISEAQSRRSGTNTTLTIHCSICGYTIYEQDIRTTPGSYNRLNLGNILLEHGAFSGFFVCPQCGREWRQQLQMVIRTKEAEDSFPHSHSVLS